jgi:hypothetical protein
MPIPRAITVDMFQKVENAQTFKTLFHCVELLSSNPTHRETTTGKLNLINSIISGIGKIYADTRWMTQANLQQIVAHMNECGVLGFIQKQHDHPESVLENLFGIITYRTGKFYAEEAVHVRLDSKTDNEVTFDMPSFHHFVSGDSPISKGHNELNFSDFQRTLLTLSIMPADLFSLVSERGLITGYLVGTIYEYGCLNPILLLPAQLIPGHMKSGLIRIKPDNMRDFLSIPEFSALNPIGIFQDCRVLPERIN